MKDVIIQESINSLKNEGLRFSIDALALKLNISKKQFISTFLVKKI